MKAAFFGSGVSATSSSRHVGSDVRGSMRRCPSAGCLRVDVDGQNGTTIRGNTGARDIRAPTSISSILSCEQVTAQPLAHLLVTTLHSTTYRYTPSVPRPAHIPFHCCLFSYLPAATTADFTCSGGTVSTSVTACRIVDRGILGYSERWALAALAHRCSLQASSPPSAHSLMALVTTTSNVQQSL